MSEDIKQTLKDFILKEFLPGESPEELTYATPLVTGGVLDSIATLKLVLFLEETYGVTFEAHETDAEHMDTIAGIEQLVESKKR
jgi:acyl carrier protein